MAVARFQRFVVVLVPSDGHCHGFRVPDEIAVHVVADPGVGFEVALRFLVQVGNDGDL